MHRVGLARGDKSYDTVKQALELIRDQVQVPPDRPVLIKPNMVEPDVPLCATPVAAVYATLEFLTGLGIDRFIIAEGTALEKGETMRAFRDYGYFSLRDTFDVEFRNLYDDDKVVLEALNATLHPVEIRLAKSLFTSYVVSVARMKTHVKVIATLTLKNIGIGAIHNPDRHSPPWHVIDPALFSHLPCPLNLSLARLGQALPIHLAVIDGVVGMEGNGPVKGTPVKSGVALAGTDALAVDLVGAELMGLDPRTIGYLWYLSQRRGRSREDVLVLGDDPATCVTRYQPCAMLQELLAWWVPDWQSYLSGTYLRDSLL
jgi:uncharacterized protein (DUF362 family)